MNQFGLSENQVQFIKSVFTKHLGHSSFQVWIFGSRATGTHRPYSDIDLLIEAQTLSASLLAKISEDFEDGNFPFKVELVDIRKLAPEYAASVNLEKKLFFQG